jgi:hypothetical protein
MGGLRLIIIHLITLHRHLPVVLSKINLSPLILDSSFFFVSSRSLFPSCYLIHAKKKSYR